MPYVNNLEKDTIENENFRKVLNTTEKSQLVVMSLLPGEDIGEEVHDVDQFIRLEEGSGKAVLDGVEYDIEDDWAIVVPAGSMHNIINTGDTKMKLYTVYTPPEHKDGTIHKTKEEAEADEHH
jgi:mannose-6-phosphate isomerase-like protein (cupin superfamily)